ncbi:MAG TPA: PQQ-dependent sugar dehydrogenase [Ktedonobacteraceae bacterium]|nr:PQQ-dependent sugar dehydrogenase [Ktedonobacteraceae bacterium]
MRRTISLLILMLLLVSGCSSSSASTISSTPTTASTPLPTSNIPGLHLPSGFQISVYASGLNTPRFMTIGPNGVLLVANRANNSVVALTPGSSPLQAAKSTTLISNLHDPSSLDMHDGYLYIGEQISIARVKLGDDLKTGPVERNITDLPEGGQLTTRTVLIGSDNHIYVAIGSSCNVCQEDDPHRAAIWIYNMDGSSGRLFAKGLRNAVGLANNPWTSQVWATNNGRDYLGDNIPPETVYALVNGGDFGWPRCHAGTITDPDFGNANSCQGIQQPLVKMQAHSAPLGLGFYPPNEKQFPTAYQSSLYIAFHGSWNRSMPTGYKVVRVPLKDGKVAGPPEDFITGWLQDNGSSTGRPVGITFAPDGTLFVSDDTHGVIYHIWYRG